MNSIINKQNEIIDKLNGKIEKQNNIVNKLDFENLKSEFQNIKFKELKLPDLEELKMKIEEKIFSNSNLEKIKLEAIRMYNLISSLKVKIESLYKMNHEKYNEILSDCEILLKMCSEAEVGINNLSQGRVDLKFAIICFINNFQSDYERFKNKISNYKELNTYIN